MWQGMTIKRDRQTVRHRHRNRKRPTSRERQTDRETKTHTHRQEMEGESSSVYSGPQQTIIIKAQVSTTTRNL